MNLVWTFLGVLGLAPAVVATAALLGLGIFRELPGWQVALSAALLVALPIAGLSAALGGSRPAQAGAVWGWSALLLLGLPGYFPDEVEDAVASGFAIFATLGGPDATKQAARFVRELPEAAGRAPPPEAARAAVPCVAAPSLSGDEVALPYEGQGHSMAVPIQFGDLVELPMLFDTGATITTLSEAGLKRVGIRVPANAPTITLRTANGERTAKLVLVPRIWVGGFPVDGVTVGVCEECADDRVEGLLGLNVSGQFLVTVDTARKEVVFKAREARSDRVVDIAPWFKVQATARVFPDERVEVEVSGNNLASRRVSSADVGIHCGSDTFVAKLTDVEPGATGTTLARLPAGVDCGEYKVTLDHASW